MRPIKMSTNSTALLCLNEGCKERGCKPSFSVSLFLVREPCRKERTNVQLERIKCNLIVLVLY